MRDGRKRAQRSEWSARLLWAVLLGCVWAGGLLVLSGTARTGLLAPPLILLGLVATAHAVHRFRHPGWRDGEWWGRHPMLANALGGASGPLPGVPERATDLFGAAIQFFVGAIFVFGGVTVAIAAVAA